MSPIPSIDYIRILPEIILIVFGTIVMAAKLAIRITSTSLRIVFLSYISLPVGG